MPLLLTLNMFHTFLQCCFADFDQVDDCWEVAFVKTQIEHDNKIAD